MYLPRALWVGAGGFEPPTSSAQGWRATRLRYTPFVKPEDQGPDIRNQKYFTLNCFLPSVVYHRSSAIHALIKCMGVLFLGANQEFVNRNNDGTHIYSCHIPGCILKL